MKHQLVAVLAWCTAAGLALGAAPPQKKAAAPTVKSAPAAQKPAAQKKAAPKVVAKRPATSSKAPATQRNRYTAYRRPVRRPTTQQSPTADRYREIQDALAVQGYLKTLPTGVWDKDSMDAMQRFQKDQNLEPTGKLTARSLGALGLGPKPQEASLLPPASTASLSATPALQ